MVAHLKAKNLRSRRTVSGNLHQPGAAQHKPGLAFGNRGEVFINTQYHFVADSGSDAMALSPIFKAGVVHVGDAVTKVVPVYYIGYNLMWA